MSFVWLENTEQFVYGVAFGDHRLCPTNWCLWFQRKINKSIELIHGNDLLLTKKWQKRELTFIKQGYGI